MKTSASLSLSPFPIVAIVHLISAIRSTNTTKTIKAHVTHGFTETMDPIFVCQALPSNAITMPILLNEFIKLV
jgi:hypothetical protein